MIQILFVGAAVYTVIHLVGLAVLFHAIALHNLRRLAGVRRGTMLWVSSFCGPMIVVTCLAIGVGHHASPPTYTPEVDARSAPVAHNMFEVLRIAQCSQKTPCTLNVIERNDGTVEFQVVGIGMSDEEILVTYSAEDCYFVRRCVELGCAGAPCALTRIWANDYVYMYVDGRVMDTWTFERNTARVFHEQDTRLAGHDVLTGR